MRFLVVDRTPNQGRALGVALIRLGHDAVVVSYAGEVPESMSVQDIDVVIASIESEGHARDHREPTCRGLELAREVAVRAPGLPIAFTAGAVLDPDLLYRASQVGPVLPCSWTDRDVELLICEVTGRLHSAFAEGTPQPRQRKLSLSCSSWEKVVRLCRGRGRICLRGKYALREGERVQVALSLPDEIVVCVEARVFEAHRHASYIELTGLGGELSTSLLSLALERTGIS